jgi:hypothetical protein
MSAMTMAFVDEYLHRYDHKKNPKDSSSKIWHDAKSTRIKMALINYRVENYNFRSCRDPHRKNKPQMKRPSWICKSMKLVSRKKKTTATGSNKMSKKKNKQSRFNKSSVAKEELKEEEAYYD